MNKKGQTEVNVILIVILLILLAVLYVPIIKSKIAEKEVKEMGYDIDTVYVFLKYRQMSFRDFVDSEPLRRQYDHWKIGEDIG